MKLSCLQENLAKGLNLVGRAVSSRPPMPMLGTVLLATDHGKLKLAATNLDLSITHWVGARVETEGAVAVPARNFIEFINSLTPEPVNLELASPSLALSVLCGGVSGQFRGLPAEDFPAIPELEDLDGVSIAAPELRRGLNRVVFAAATDETHPVLQGVLAEFEDDRVTLVGGDGFRIAVERVPLEAPIVRPFSVIIPARALTELMRILSGADEPVTIGVTRHHNQVIFRLSSTVLNAQLIDGTFPDYRRIIPTTHTTRIIVAREEWLQACKRAGIFARDAANMVRLSLTPGEMLVASSTTETGEGLTRLQAVLEGEPMDITFNVKYLTDVLSALDEPQVSLELTSHRAPGVITPVGESSYLYVVMPMYLNR